MLNEQLRYKTTPTGRVYIFFHILDMNIFHVTKQYLTGFKRYSLHINIEVYGWQHKHSVD